MLNTQLASIEIEDWVIRYRLPPGRGPHPVIWLFHGWTGDEDSMWIFAARLPENYLLLAPRGLHPTPLGGFSWHPLKEGKSWPEVDDFRPAVEKIIALIDHWPAFPAADFSQMRLAGFSQGGALAYAFTLLHPKRVASLAGLASFLPEGAATHLEGHPLHGLPVYISHGTQDKLVPIERARQAVQLLDQAGAKVWYCESDVGHKLSADCFRGMEVFFQESVSAPGS